MYRHSPNITPAQAVMGAPYYEDDGASVGAESFYGQLERMPSQSGTGMPSQYNMQLTDTFQRGFQRTNSETSQYFQPQQRQRADSEGLSAYGQMHALINASDAASTTNTHYTNQPYYGMQQEAAFISPLEIQDALTTATPATIVSRDMLPGHIANSTASDSVVSFHGIVVDVENTGEEHPLTFYYDMNCQEVLGADIHTCHAVVANDPHCHFGTLTPYAVIIQPDQSRAHYFQVKLPEGGCMYFGITCWLEHAKRFRYKVWFPIVHPAAFETSIGPRDVDAVEVFFDRRSGQVTGACLRDIDHRTRPPSAIAVHPHELLTFFTLGTNKEFAVLTKYYDQTVRFEVLFPIPNPLFFETVLFDTPLQVVYNRATGEPIEARVVGVAQGVAPYFIDASQHQYPGNLFYFQMLEPYDYVRFHLIQSNLNFTVMPFEAQS